ncbi:hypothetical protein M2171_002595 [Bradyrhizobium japonicum USDA 38]|uniref:hypothetical protein n=1 Tax=Bradyrhizobium japonicum TaxID=375 RepID=UPI0003FC2E13|nr:hypothetical protein [Bradyrhizobium japonicum]MCS3893462.1 hypothetical protein [Bradyrhizobium japonicum USDA 38]MCS3945976.1 hypothetical protein [Bradyrhizobium japonicum]
MLSETATTGKIGVACTEAKLDRLTVLYAETDGDCRAAMGRRTERILTKVSINGLDADGNDLALRKCLGGCNWKLMSPDKDVPICARCRCNIEIRWGGY